MRRSRQDAGTTHSILRCAAKPFARFGTSAAASVALAALAALVSLRSLAFLDILARLVAWYAGFNFICRLVGGSSRGCNHQQLDKAARGSSKVACSFVHNVHKVLCSRIMMT